MKFLSALIGSLLMVVLAVPASAVVIVDEDFESYANDAAFHVNWAGSDGFASPGTPAEVENQFELVSLSADNPDFNGDNIVGAADYTRWRDNLGATGVGIQTSGDANNDGVVDQLDYDSWKNHFGGPPPTGGGQVVEHLINYVNKVPENGPVRVPDGVVEYQPVLNPNNTEDGSVFPTEAEPVVAKVDIFVDERQTETFWPRQSLGLRNVFDGTTLDIVEMGIYNDDSAYPGFESRGFAIRIQLWQVSGGATNPNWQYFDLPTSFYDDDGDGLVLLDEVTDKLGPGWHRLEAEIGPDSVTFTLDLLRDGIDNATGLAGVDATLTFDGGEGTLTPNFGFNNLRFGGPSNLYTVEHALFDNIFLSGPQDTIPGALNSANVPEPSTLMIGLLLVLGVAACRQR